MKKKLSLLKRANIILKLYFNIIKKNFLITAAFSTAVSIFLLIITLNLSRNKILDRSVDQENLNVGTYSKSNEFLENLYFFQNDNTNQSINLSYRNTRIREISDKTENIKENKTKNRLIKQLDSSNSLEFFVWNQKTSTLTTSVYYEKLPLREAFFQRKANSAAGSMVVANQIVSLNLLMKFFEELGVSGIDYDLSNCIDETKGNEFKNKKNILIMRAFVFINVQLLSSLGRVYSYLKEKNTIYFLELLGADLVTQFVVMSFSDLVLSSATIVTIYKTLSFLFDRPFFFCFFCTTVIYLSVFLASILFKTIFAGYSMTIIFMLSAVWTYFPFFYDILDTRIFDSYFVKILTIFIHPGVGVNFILKAFILMGSKKEIGVFSADVSNNLSIRSATFATIAGVIANFLLTFYCFLNSKDFKLSNLNPISFVFRLYKFFTKRKKQVLLNNREYKRSPDAVISAVNISKRFSTVTGSFTAVNDVSFDLKRGDKIALLGHNGAGKTTMLSILTGIETPSSGQLWFNNQRYYSSSDLVGLIGYCPQYTTFFPNFTVEENIDLILSFYEVNSEEAEKVKNSLLCELDLSSFTKKQPGKLSGGQRRKLNFLMAIIHSPPIVFLDESSTGVDVLSRGKMVHLLHKYCADSIVILSTHIVEEAESFASRVFIMDKGKLVASGSIPEIKKQFGCSGKRLTIHLNHPTVLSQKIEKFLSENTATFSLLRRMSTKLSYSIDFSDYNQLSRFYENLSDKKDELQIESFGVNSATIEEVLNREEFHEIKDKDPKNEANAFKKHFERIKENQQQTHKLGLAVSRCLSVLWNRMKILMNRPSILFFQMVMILFAFRFLSTAKIREPYAMLGYVATYKNAVDQEGKKKVSVSESIGNQLKDHLARKYPEFSKRFEFELTDVDYSQHSSRKIFESLKTKKADLAIYRIGSYTDNVNVKVFGEDKNAGDVIVLNQILADLFITLNVKNNFGSTDIQLESPTKKTKELLQEILEKISDGTLKFDVHTEVKSDNNSIFEVYQIQDSLITIFLILVFMTTIGYLNSEYFSKSKSLKINYGLPRLGSIFLDVFIDSLVLFSLLQICLLILYLTKRNLKNEFFSFSLSCSLLLASFAFFFALYALASLFKGFYSFQSICLCMLYLKGILFGIFLYIKQMLSLEKAFYFPFVYYFNAFIPLEQVLTMIFVPTITDYMKHLSNSYYAPVVSLSTSFILDVKEPYSPHYVFEGSELTKFTAKPFLDPFDPTLKIDIISLLTMFVSIIVLIIGEYELLSFLERKLLGFSIASALKSKSMKWKLEDESVQKERELVANKLTNFNPTTFQGLIINKISKAYTKLLPPETVVALNSFTIFVDEGESIGILGANGGGKTTAFKILMKETSPDAGKVYSKKAKDVVDQFSYTPQYECLNEDQTPVMVLQNFAMIRGFGVLEAHRLAKTVSTIVNLGKNRNKTIAHLSGGNKRKIAIGLSLLSNAKVLVMDEPTTGVDVTNSREIWEIIRKLLKGRSLVLASHLMQEVEELTTKVAILVKGVTKAVGTTDFLRKRFGTELEVKVYFDGKTKFGELEDKLKGKFNRIRFDQPNLNSAKFFVEKRETTISALIELLGDKQSELGLLDYEVNEMSLESVLAKHIAEE